MKGNGVKDLLEWSGVRKEKGRNGKVGEMEKEKEFGVGGVGKIIGVGKTEKYGFNFWSGEKGGKMGF